MCGGGKIQGFFTFRMVSLDFYNASTVPDSVTTVPDPSSEAVSLVGLLKEDFGHTCVIHDDGCGRHLELSDRVILKMTEIEEEIPVPVSNKRGRKRKEAVDMPQLTKNTSEQDLMVCTIPMLKDVLSGFRLSKIGKKEVLIGRIIEHIASSDEFHGEEVEDPEATNDGEIEDGSISSESDAEEVMNFEEEDEFPELQRDDALPDASKSKMTVKVKACEAFLIRNDVPTCKVGFVAKPFLNLYGNSLHNRVGLVVKLLHRSYIVSERERSHKGNGMATIFIERLRT